MCRKMEFYVHFQLELAVFQAKLFRLFARLIESDDFFYARNLTSGWFAERVYKTWQDVLARH